MSTMKDRIRELCEEKGISLAALERGAGIPDSSINRWDKNIPSADKLAKVASYLGVTVEFLLNGESDETDVMMLREQLRRRPETKLLFDVTRDATPEQILAVAEMIEKWKT